MGTEFFGEINSFKLVWLFVGKKQKKTWKAAPLYLLWTI